jgi:hypothetical protein
MGTFAFTDGLKTLFLLAHLLLAASDFLDDGKLYEMY